MKKLQLYKIKSEEVDNSMQKIISNENPSVSDYYSIYSQYADIILVEKEKNIQCGNEINASKMFYHPNSNLNEYHKMIQAKTFSEPEKGKNRNFINSNVKMKDNFITIQLNTREKLSK